VFISSVDGECVVGRNFVLSLVFLASLGLVGAAFAGPPAGVPTGGGGRPDFAGSGRPDFSGSAASSSRGYGPNTNPGTSQGNSSTAGSFPSTSNAGGNALNHAAPNAQPTLQALEQGFSEGDLGVVREFFAARAQDHTPDQAVPVATEWQRGQKLTAEYLAEPLPADLLAQLPNRPGLTYVRVGDDVLLLAGPDDVIVDIIPGVAGGDPAD